MKKICFVTLFVLMLKFYLNSQTITFSQSGGFYNNSFNLELTCDGAYQIRYTTNGSTPTASSTLYESPLHLDENLYSQSNIFTIPTTIDELLFIPESVKRCITIRAGLFDTNNNPVGDVVTQSYFISSLGIDTHGLSVVSIAADSASLFDYYTGILVPGVHFNPNNPYWTGNYYEKGEEWERLVNVEFYEYSDNSGINQKAGLRTHGGTARRIPQKGLKLYARKEYGKKRFNHQFFNELPNNSFKHLVLKPFCDQWFVTGIQDDICNHMAKDIDIESLVSRPIVLFLNGEYWGIYYLRENPDSHYLEDHFGHEDTDYNVIGNWYGEVEDGDSTNFVQMMDWLKDADLAIEENYAYICSLIDVNSFIDYYCMELFIANNDWPANNMRCWQLNDGRWRWIFFDGDDCLLKMDFDVFANATCLQNLGWPTDSQSTLMFRKLLKNNDFHDRFFDRFEQLMTSVFSYGNTSVYYETAAQKVRDEIPQQADRFNRPPSLSQWEYDILSLDDFLRRRVDDMRHRIEDVLYVDTPTSTIAVFPNPTSGGFHVIIQDSEAESLDATIFDMTGRAVYSKTISDFGNTFFFNPDLPAGVYLIKIGNLTQRIVIQ